MLSGKILPGTIVEPISPNRGMAIFKSESGGRFIRAKEEDNIWKAITLLEYKGPGLVIFLSNVDEINDLQRIGPGEVLRSDLKVRVDSVYDRHAVGEVISGPKYKSLEESLDDLIALVDTDEKENIEFGGEIFSNDDITLILKLQTALYKHRTTPRIQERNNNEDGNSTVTNGNNETGNIKENHV